MKRKKIKRKKTLMKRNKKKKKIHQNMYKLLKRKVQSIRVLKLFK